MKAKEFIKGFKVFGATVKVKQPNYTQLVNTTVFAQNVNMAKMIFNQQFGKDALISNVREIKI
jgi:hypothetical protein